jgi:amino acid transporter
VVLTVVGLLYGIGIVFWGIPYTILVIGLLIWSRNKSFNRIYKTLFYSPYLLSALTIIGFLITGLLFPMTSAMRLPLLEDWVNLIWYSFLATILNLIFGYFFVGVCIGSYKIFERLKLIQNEEEITENALLTLTEVSHEDFGGSVDK